MLTASPLERSVLLDRLAGFPRAQLAFLPTPLEDCPRFSAALGGPRIFVKRDDLTGLALGGNKARQLEYVFGEVLASDADTVVAGAYAQSNWCRQITAAARKHGLEPALVLAHGVKGPLLQGNLLLDLLMDADVRIIRVLDEELAPHLEHRAEELRRVGRRPRVISSFDLHTQSLAALGYVQAVVEICDQLEAAPDYIYVAGSEMSPAGLIVGVRALGLKTRVVSVSPIVYPEPRQEEIARICNAVAELLGLDLRWAPASIGVDDGYVGEGYGIVSEAGREAMLMLARMEGLILDPVYTSKAMAGLIDHVRRGRVGIGDNVVFIHTGGLPTLFAYASELSLTPPVVLPEGAAPGLESDR